MSVSVNVHLHATVGNSGVDLGLSRARSSVEDEEAVDKRREAGVSLCTGKRYTPSVASRENVHGEGVLRLKLLVAVSLVLGEELGLEDNVSGLVDTVDVSEGGGDRESGGDGEEGVVDVEDVLGLGVERGVVDTCERGAWSVGVQRRAE